MQLVTDLNLVWNTVLQIGSLAGLVTGSILIWDRLTKWFNRPRLRILQNFTSKEFNFKRSKTELFTLEVENIGKKKAERCLAFLEVIEAPKGFEGYKSKYPISWNGVDLDEKGYVRPIDLGPKEPRELFVIIACKGKIGTCSIATAFSLKVHTSIQDIETGESLIPGEYKIKVEINCANGDGTEKYFKVNCAKDGKFTVQTVGS